MIKHNKHDDEEMRGNKREVGGRKRERQRGRMKERWNGRER